MLRTLRTTVGGLAALVALAVLVSGAALRADQPKDPPKKDDVKKEEPKKDDVKRDEPKKDATAKGDSDFQKQLDQLRKDLEEMRRSMDQFRRGFPGRMPEGFNPGEMMARFRPQGRLGVMVEKPGDALADQLDLKQGQGLVIHDVRADSAAAKSGFKNHDVIVELNGKPVTDDVGEFARMINDIKANTPVDAVVVRKGKKETIKGVSLPEAPPEAGRAFPGFPGRPTPRPDGAPNPSR
jgi:C-terminal processing protease CtpA/Prc